MVLSQRGAGDGLRGYYRAIDCQAEGCRRGRTVRVRHRDGVGCRRTGPRRRTRNSSGRSRHRKSRRQSRRDTVTERRCSARSRYRFERCGRMVLGQRSAGDGLRGHYCAVYNNVCCNLGGSRVAGVSSLICRHNDSARASDGEGDAVGSAYAARTGNDAEDNRVARAAAGSRQRNRRHAVC